MIAQDIVARAMKEASEAQAVMGSVESTSVSYENDRLKALRSTQSTAISLRVIVDGRLGISRSTDPDDRDGVVKRALEAAAFGSPVHFTLPGQPDLTKVETYDGNVPATAPEEMVKIGGRMVAAVKEHNSEILVGAGVSRSVSRSEFANSAGAVLSEEATGFSLGVSGQLVRGTDILWVGHGFGWKKREIDDEEVTARVVNLFRMAEKIVPVSSGDMPVIFTPEGMNVLLLPLRLGFNGKNVVLRSSPLAGKEGKKVADARFSLTDDPLIDYAGGSSSYDGEGVAHRVNTLIGKGVVENFLYDLDTAGRAGTASTGNGIGCGTTNLVVGTGSKTFEEMVKETKEGLLVHDVIGLGQGNPLSGEFSVNVNLGYRIENGEITGRVKNVMLAGNTFDAINRIDSIGSEAQWAGGRLLTPPVKISSLSVVAGG